MEGMMDPPPPGIVPNFPPQYPFKWQQKIMPEPHPNHLRSMGLPASFGTQRHPKPGNGGYQYVKGYESGPGTGDYNYNGEGYDGHNGENYEGYNGEGHDGHNEGHEGFNGESYEEELYNKHSHGYTNGPSDEFGAFDDSEAWQDDCEWDENGEPVYGNNQGQHSHEYNSNLRPVFGAPAPAPTGKGHYYNLAPKPLSGNGNIKSNGYGPNNPPQAMQKQGPSEAKKRHLRMVYGDRYCEGCNFGFHSLEKYQEHLESHVKCPFTGCGLETTIERLDDHLTVAHILNPESTKQIDTEEYIRQRKNKFPSLQRAQLRTALLEQQRKRGEILAMDHMWENKGGKMDCNNEDNDVAAGASGITTSTVETSHAGPCAAEVDACHVDSHEYEPVNWTKSSNRSHFRKQDNHVEANAKRKLIESNRQRTTAKRRKVASQQKREVVVEPEVDVLSRIPAFCGIEEYREDPPVDVLANTLAQNDASQSEPDLVFHISDDEDDIPSAHSKSSPVENNASNFPEQCSNNLDTPSKNSIEELAAEGASKGVSATLAVAGSGALRLLLGDYGTDSEDEDSENTCIPVVGTVSLNEHAVSAVHGNVVEPQDNFKSIEQNVTASTTSGIVERDSGLGSGTGGFKGGEARCKEGSSPNALSPKKNVGLDTGSESEEEMVDAKGLGSGDGSKRRRRGKRGRKKRKCPIAEADANLEEKHTSPNDVQESSSCNGKSNSAHESSTRTPTKVFVPSIAPHLKPLNKKEENSEDECLEPPPRERVPTTRWTEDKIFSYQLKGQYKKFKNNYKKSLLVKLLGDEVTRERNIILQCAKYIVQNDFFEQRKVPSIPQPKRVLVEEIPAGDSDKPDGDKPDGDKPDGDKPDGDKPEGDKPDTDKMEVNVVKLNEPEGEDGNQSIHANNREIEANEGKR